MASSPAWRVWVRAARQRFGLSQAEVGRRCIPPISAGRMSDLERGLKKPRDMEVAAITQVLTDARRQRGETNPALSGAREGPG